MARGLNSSYIKKKVEGRSHIYLTAEEIGNISPGGGGATNAGVAAFTALGPTFVDIVLGTAMANTGYSIYLTAGSSTGTPPSVFYDPSTKTVNGFRIYAQDAFTGEVSWATFNKTQ